MNSITDYLQSIEAREKEATPEAVSAEFLCDCETCRHTAAICPASASSLILEVAALRGDIHVTLLLARKYREALEEVTAQTWVGGSSKSIAARALEYDPREDTPPSDFGAARGKP